MKYTAKKNNENQYEIEITLDKDALVPYLDKAFQKEVKEVEADGFRKGKMPKDMFIKKYGIARLYPEAVDILLNENYRKILEDEGIEPIAPVNFDYQNMQMDAETGFAIKGTVPVMPEIKIDGYKSHIKGMALEPVNVEADEIKNHINDLVDKNKMLIIKEGAAENGDTVVIDFEGFLNDEPFEGGKGEAYPLVLGSNSFIPGFEDQLVGAKAGESVEVKVTFPEDYHAENLKGQEVIFKCVVHEVKTKEDAELNDEFVKSLPGFDVETVAELEEKVKADLQKSKEVESKNQFNQKLLEKLAENIQFDVPEELVNHELDHAYEGFKQQLAQQGMSLEDYQERMKTDENKMKAEMRQDVEKRVKESIILKEIIKLENIEVTDADIDSKFEEMAKMYGMDLQTIKDVMGQNTDHLKEQIKYEKVFDEMQK